MKRIPKILATTLAALTLTTFTATVPVAKTPSQAPSKALTCKVSTRISKASPAEGSIKIPRSQAGKSSAKTPKSPKPPKADKGGRTSKDSKNKFEGKLNVNTASAEQFDKLPRVGPKLADHIAGARVPHQDLPVFPGRKEQT